MTRRLEATVVGRVQGVSFRYATQQQARQLGLSGWVRNERDGSVLVIAEGPEDELRQLLTFLHHGPPMARVRAVDVAWGEPRPETGGFQIRF